MPLSAMDEQNLREQLQRYCAYLAQDPQNVRLYLDTLDVAIRVSDKARIETLLDAPPLAAADSIAFLNLKGLAMLASSQFQLAEACFRQLLDRVEQGRENVVFNLANALAFQGRYADAEQILQQAELVPRNMQLLLQVLHLRDKLDALIAIALPYLEAHPEDHAVTGRLALVYMDQQDMAAARQWAERSLQYGESEDAMVVLGYAHMEDNIPLAQQFFNHARHLAPAHGRAWLGQGLCAASSGNIHEAIQLLSRAAELQPEHPGTWHALAWSQMALQQWRQAEYSLQQALIADRNFADTHGALAVVAIMQGREAEAPHQIEVALRLNPQSFAAHYARSVLLERQGHAAQAKRIVEGLLASPLPGSKDPLGVLVQRLQQASRQQMH